MMAKGTKIWTLLFFFIFSLFSSVVFAEGDDEEEPSESDKDKVDLLRVRDLGIMSFSISRTMTSSTNEIGYFTAYYNDEELTLEVANYEGRYYGIPSIASPRVLLYRKDYLEQAGFDHPPDTWDELKLAAQKVTQAVDGVYGFGFCSSSDAIRGPQEFLPFLWQTGAEWVVKQDGKWIPGFTAAQAEEVFALYNDLMNTLKACPPDSIGWGYLELDNAFVVGQIAMCHNGSWMQLYRDKAGESFKYWKGAPMPKNKNRATYFEVKVEGIGKFSKYKDEAWKFLTWLMGKDQMARHTRHDNLPSRSDVVSLPEYQEDEWKKPFFEVIPDGKPYPPIPMAESNKAMMDELQAVLYQQKTPAEAAQDLLARLEVILETINEE